MLYCIVIFSKYRDTSIYRYVPHITTFIHFFSVSVLLPCMHPISSRSHKILLLFTSHCQLSISQCYCDCCELFGTLLLWLTILHSKEFGGKKLPSLAYYVQRFGNFCQWHIFVILILSCTNRIVAPSNQSIIALISMEVYNSPLKFQRDLVRSTIENVWENHDFQNSIYDDACMQSLWNFKGLL